MKKVIDYSTREIIFYKFICNDPTIISTYVGHTTNFTDRKRQHKNTCLNINNKKYNLLIYKTIRENGGWDNWIMFEIERKIVSSRQEALQYEQYLIDLQVEKLNMFNAVKNHNYQKNYRDTHIEEYNNYRKIYREINKEKIALQVKQYETKHKEQICLRRKNYHNQNKEQINLKQREKYYQKKELNLMSKEDKY